MACSSAPSFLNSGPVAQLGARFHGMEEVVGSIPTRSTKFRPMHSVDILRSETTHRLYIGCTSRLIERLAEHRRGQTASTRARGSWTLIYEEQFATLDEARRRERQLKSWKSQRSILQLV